MSDLKALHEAATPDTHDFSHSPPKSVVAWGKAAWRAYAEGRLVEVDSIDAEVLSEAGLCTGMFDAGFCRDDSDACPDCSTKRWVYAYKQGGKSFMRSSNGWQQTIGGW